MAGCVICTNQSDRGYDRKLRIGYSVDLIRCVSRHFSAPTEPPSSSATVGMLYSITVCSQCRYDLIGAIRRWINGDFIRNPSEHRKDVEDCPVCGAADQDGRTLRIAHLPGLDQVSDRFSFERGIAFLSTCGACRGDFTAMLVRWILGEFIADRRPVV